MKRKCVFTMLCTVLSALCFIFSSCSSNEENVVNGSLTVNGESFLAEEATISDGISNEDVLVGRMFGTKIIGSDDYYFFTLEYIHWDNNGHYSFELVEGDITDFISVETFSHSPVTISGYDYISGKVFLTRNKNIITLNFQNYTFINENDWKFVLNGAVKYIE